MTSINLLKVASLPGSGSGCQSALPAEVGKGKPRTLIGEIVGVYASEPNPCEAKYSKPMNFGSMPAEPSPKPLTMAEAFQRVQEIANKYQFTRHRVNGGGMAGRNRWTVTRSAFEVEEAIAAGHAVEKLGPAMWKITRPADLLDAAGGGE